MMHDLESCTGNDTLMSSSDIRRTAHTLPLLLAGSDFLFSGFGSIPAYDNAFGPSNFNAEDIDDYLVVQRDWGFEGVPAPAVGRRAAAAAPARRRGAAARCYDELDLARFSDADAEAVVQAHGSLDVPRARPAPRARRRRPAHASAASTALDVVRALAARGFEVEAERVLEMLRQRLYGDYLQTSAIFDRGHAGALGAQRSRTTTPGPGTGYRMTRRAPRRDRRACARCGRPRRSLAEQNGARGLPAARASSGRRRRGTRPDEVVVGALARVRAHDLALALGPDGRRGAAPGAGRASRRRARRRASCRCGARSTSARSARRPRGSRARASASGCRPRARR